VTTTQSAIQRAQDYAGSVLAGDLDQVLLAMGPEPVFELYPIAKRFKGAAKVRRHFQYFLAEARSRIVASRIRSTWVGDAGVGHEIDLTVTLPGAASPSTHRVFRVILIVDDQVVGERIYSDEKMLRLLIGSLWNSLEPIPAD
jgi:hypothetical protein